MAKSEKILVRSQSGYRMVSVDEKITSPFTLPEPQWVSDDECKHCQNRDCQVKFDFFQRKHHCRRCGQCFCKKCSGHLVALPRMCFIDPVRHCLSCHRTTQAENEFFDKHLKTLTTGGYFCLHSDEAVIDSMETKSSFKCSLSADHRLILFEGQTTGPDKILVDKIQSVQISAVKVDPQGNHLGKGIAIHYCNGVGEVVWIKMDVEEGVNSKQAMSWVAAMLKAFKMIYQAREDSEKNR